MRAFKFQVQIGNDHMLHLQLPDDLQEGLAEVIILIAEDGFESEAVIQAVPEESQGLAKFLEKNRLDQRWAKSKQELDLYLANERDCWES